MMKTLLFMVLTLTPSIACGAEPFARTSIEDGGKVVPGQQVRVDVDVFVPDFFTSPPQFPLFDLPNALVTLPEERSENIVQTVDGIQYSGIRKAYAIVPQVSGTFTLPEVDIDLGYSVDGKPTKALVKMPSVSFTVAGSTSANQQPIAFAARNLTIEQSFDQNGRSLKVGDALVRTITIIAEDTQAMLIPPVAVGNTAGLRQYAKPPKIEDGISVGRETASRRIETYVYAADKDGSFVIPAASFTWYDVASGETKSASLPSIPVTVSAGLSETAIKPVLDQVQSASPHVYRQKIALAILVLLAVAAVAWTGPRLLPILARKLREIRQRYRASHSYRLKSLRHVIRSGDDMEIYSGLRTWSQSLGYRTMEDWVCDGPADLKIQVDSLSRKLFRSGSSDNIDRKKLIADIGFHRLKSRQRATPLPPLNP
ncbi:hypothetical protein [Candidatus Phyllobacterium onerii]|uniref:hypothetical protein n=1 Tax=Candidatus Phyllobacterium onerii TaxID=3020828 RepID=UPI00232AA26D|nr:hypothetical protein [Phyllobacterium sp. IY22]